MSTSFYLIRHGDYAYRPSPEGDATSDFGLSELGIRQAEALRSRLATSREIKANAFYCSSLPRSLQTAEVLVPALGLKPTVADELCEWESGNDSLGESAFTKEWNRLTDQERPFHRFRAGCETIIEFNQRVQTKLHQLELCHSGQTVVLVVHGGVIEVAFAYFLGMGSGPYRGGFPASGHTSITLWRRSQRRSQWVLEYSNDMHHLRSDA